MALTLKLDDPAYEKGDELSIKHLGLFVNGEEREITPEQEERFVMNYGMDLRDAFEGNTNVKIAGSKTVKVDDLPEVSETPVIEPATKESADDKEDE